MLKLFPSSKPLVGLLAAPLLTVPLLAQRTEFHPPVRLKGGDQFAKVEAPGYAAPCWADIDADGHKDLIVGQFAGGKLRIYRNRGERNAHGHPQLEKGVWLEVDGNVAQVPGVW